MSDDEFEIKATDSQDLLRLLKDLFASDLSSGQRDKLNLFLSGKGYITLGSRKYTKEDLKDLFYSQN